MTQHTSILYSMQLAAHLIRLARMDKRCTTIQTAVSRHAQSSGHTDVVCPAFEHAIYAQRESGISNTSFYHKNGV